MKQLFIFIALFITLGSVAGLPAPETKEVQDVDRSALESDIAEFDEDTSLHKVERRAVSPSEVSFR